MVFVEETALARSHGAGAFDFGRRLPPFALFQIQRGHQNGFVETEVRCLDFVCPFARFGKFFGAQDETFLGLSGVGDLFLTASSALSRNYRVGLGLARGKKLDEILSELGEVAEGVYTASAVVALAAKNRIYVPIATEVYEILRGKDVEASLRDLLRKR